MSLASTPIATPIATPMPSAGLQGVQVVAAPLLVPLHPLRLRRRLLQYRLARRVWARRRRGPLLRGEPPFQVKGGYPSVWGGEDATQLTFLCLGLAAICQALVLIETLFFPWQDLGVLYITSINMLASDSTPPRPPPPALGPCQHGGGVPRGVRGGASAGAWSMTGTTHTPPGV